MAVHSLLTGAAPLCGVPSSVSLLSNYGRQFARCTPFSSEHCLRVSSAECRISIGHRPSIKVAAVLPWQETQFHNQCGSSCALAVTALTPLPFRCKIYSQLKRSRMRGAGSQQCRLKSTRVRCSAGDDNEDTENGKAKVVSTATEDPQSQPSSGAPSQGKKDEAGEQQLGRKQDSTKDIQIDELTLFELLGPEKVAQEDVKVLKDKLFGYSTFWVTGQEPFGDSGEGVLLLGNLRANREDVFKRLQLGMQELMGDKYDLFMVEEPEAEDADPRGGQRVSFLLLRKKVSQGGPTSVWQYIIAVILALITAGSCLELGLATQVSKLPPEVVNYFNSADPDSLEAPDLELLVPFVQQALPLAYGVLGVQVFYELGRRLVASQRKVRLSIPYVIPNITIGTFGAVTQWKSPAPDRKAKFDLAMAGGLAGGTLSLAMLATGLALTSSPEAREQLVQVPALLFQGSLLLGGTCRFVLGYDAMHAATVSIHPLVIAGWCGLTTTALNLLPMGSLDGGRAMQAVFGKVALAASSFLTYVLLGVGLLGGPLALAWGLYVVIIQRNAEKPCLNDVTEVGNLRQGAYITVFFAVLLTLLPIWESLADEWGIGLGSSVF